MPTQYQQAITGWQQRANQFAAAGIPTGAWSKLYAEDMAGVYQGRQPMSNAEVYAGVLSDMRGPVIHDPTRVIAHHSSILSTIGDVIKNVPSDVGGMITGLEGIPHILRHLPSEATNTGKLLYNLADGNNAWLQKNGYLPQGQNLHESWSDFAMILRAMDANGDKQLLPFLPFISDIANMTSGQGRAYLQQHPIGAFLDVYPGIIKVGKLATDSLALEKNADERGAMVRQLQAQGLDEKTARQRTDLLVPPDYSNIYRDSRGNRDPGQKSPRFYAAGRALQLGNPVKAAVSAVGDIIPVGVDKFGTSITLRDWVNMRAASSGLDRWIREGLNRPLNDLSDELDAISRHLKTKVFGKTVFFSKNANAIRRNYMMFMVTHGINPDNAATFGDTPFESNAAAIKYMNETFTEDEKASVILAQSIAEDQKGRAIAEGRGAMIPDIGTRIPHFFLTSSPVYKTWQDTLKAQDELVAAQHTGNADRIIKATEKLQKANDEFAHARYITAPDEWSSSVAIHIRTSILRDARKFMTEESFQKVQRELSTSLWESQYRQLMGDAYYEKYRDDAMAWWRRLETEGFTAIWTHGYDPEAYDEIFNPKVGRIDKPTTPSAFAKEPHSNWGLNFGHSVYNLGILLTNHEVEMFREEGVKLLLKDYIIPHFTVDIAQKKQEYYDAIMSARQAGKLKKVGPWNIDAEIQRLLDEDFVQLGTFGLREGALDPAAVGTRYITREAKDAIEEIYNPRTFALGGVRVIRSGTQLYKFAVLTGVRHFVHVSLGGLMFMLGRDPMAVTQMWRAWRILKGLHTGMQTEADAKLLAEISLAGHSLHTLGGLRARPYDLDVRRELALHRYWDTQVTGAMGEHLTTSWIHEAYQKGITAAEYIPNKLANLEEKIMDMYRVSVMLQKFKETGDRTTAIAAAHKTFVDINGMSTIERTVMKQVFPFYAFTRHLFKYLFQYPSDFPLRAAIISQFAEGEQQDWNSGLPRSYMSMFWLGQPNKDGDVRGIDLKNINPFRSFANDFGFAGFFSSLSPFLSVVPNVAGINLLSGTTQLYPGTVYNPQTGTLQATTPPGAQWVIGETFLPQVGLLDHYFKFTQQTRMLAKYDRAAYNNQLYNMLNVPFVPEVYNVPYEKEITEMRRFRQAQTDLAAVENDPSAQNVNKLLQWNLVPWNNWLIPPNVLANYYKRVEKALKAAHSPILSPKAALLPPVTHPATLQSFGSAL